MHLPFAGVAISKLTHFLKCILKITRCQSWESKAKDDKSQWTVKYLLSEKKCYTVGRKNCDIILSDPSLSRLHCELSVAVTSEHTQNGVWLTDKKSKYGTYIKKNGEWVKIDEENAQHLSNGAVIRFGLMENIWRLEHKPLVACTSRLTNKQNQELKMLMSTVDGRLLSKWTKQCTLVFVNDVTLTVKILLALINGIPIVKTNYINQLVENVKQDLSWPDYTLFRPEISESTLVPHLVSLNPEDHRKELFKGKTFLIPTENQLSYLSEIIVAAGGTARLLELSGNCQELAADNIIIVQYPCSNIMNPDLKAKKFKNVENVLRNEYGIRAVPETEIFQAIAYSSTEKYCNPSIEAFKLREVSVNQNPNSTTLEAETRSNDCETGTHDQKPPELDFVRIDVIPSSSSAISQRDYVTSKRKRNCSSGDGDKASKRFASSGGQEEIQKMFVPETEDPEGEKTDLFAEEIDYVNDENTELSKSTSCDRKRTFSWYESDNSENKKRKVVDATESNPRRTERASDQTTATLEVKSTSNLDVSQQFSSLKVEEEVLSVTDWIQMKNSRGRRINYDESEFSSKNTKVFKKKEVYRYEGDITREEFEGEEGNLLASGWLPIRSNRPRLSCQM